MLIRLLCAHEMTKHVCKISHLNSKWLLRKLQKILGGCFILPHPVGMFIYLILAVLQAHKLSDNRFKKHNTIQQYVYITC